MSEPWHYQMRVYLSDALAEMVRRDPDQAMLKPLASVLARHHATMKSQFDAFEAYIAEAEQGGAENFPLYKWTKATLEDPAKRSKHFKAFALHVAGAEVYSQEAAEALEADLLPLVDGERITHVSKHDTNPANNLPVPPEYRA